MTRDKNIRYRVNELATMRAANLHVFVFIQGALTARETGQLLVEWFPAIAHASATFAPPAFFSIARSGNVRPLKIGD